MQRLHETMLAQTSSWDTAYHPDFGRPVAYRFEAMPEDPNAQVRMTVERAIRLILDDATAPLIQSEAQKLLCAENPIIGLWQEIKPRIRFQQDYDSAQRLDTADPRKRQVVETFVPPLWQAWLIKTRGQGFEDCDGFTMYGACLLVALGIPVCMCTVAAERERPWEYSHVYLVAYWNGRRIPLDLSHGPYPGWECPNLGRKREWIVCEETLRPSPVIPLLLAAAAGGYLLWRNA